MSLSCPICDEIVWEDDWCLCDSHKFVPIHEKCRKQYIRQEYHLSEAQFNKLYGIDEMRRQLADFKTYTLKVIKSMEDDIKKLEGMIQYESGNGNCP